MKRRFAAMIVSLACIFAVACKDKSKDTENMNVPAEVKTAFTAKYAGAEDVVWEDAHENNVFTYKAKFKMNGKEVKAEFTKEGELVKEKQD